MLNIGLAGLHVLGLTWSGQKELGQLVPFWNCTCWKGVPKSSSAPNWEAVR